MKTVRGRARTVAALGAAATAVAAGRRLSALGRSSGVSADDVAAALPGDAIVPRPQLVVDRAFELPAPPEQVWPWLVQLGRSRAGWYLPAAVESVLPERGRGLRALEPRWQQLAVGDRVPDWGPGAPEFRVEVLDPPWSLVYSSLRDRSAGHAWPSTEAPMPASTLVLSWALHLSERGPVASRLHLRLRAAGMKRDWPAAALAAAGLFDWVTVVGLEHGLRERLTDAADRPLADPVSGRR